MSLIETIQNTFKLSDTQVTLYGEYQPGWCAQGTVSSSLVPAIKAAYPQAAEGQCNAHHFQVPMGSKDVDFGGQTFHVSLWEHMCMVDETECVRHEPNLFTRALLSVM